MSSRSPSAGRSAELGCWTAEDLEPGVLLVGVTPGGFEKMFEERQGVDAEKNQALMKAHNMEVVGPPLQ